jgi:hypothetical protein
MRKDTLYIATASWEPRFLEGARRILGGNDISNVLCFWFEDYESRVAGHLRQFTNEFKHLSPKLEKLRLIRQDSPETTQTELWKRIFDVFAEEIASVGKVVFDITTTPRIALWIILDLLTEAKIPVTIVYHQADSHGPWCASEPDRPHIVPKLGGISDLDKCTKLIIISGFDEDRSEHFISYFEPTETIILLQEGFPDEDSKRNQEPHIKRFQGRPGIKMQKMNSYAPDWGYAGLEKIAMEFGKDSNLVLASVGPKTSAVALYHLHRRMPHSSIAYSPCRNYNEIYSLGIRKTLTLEWDSSAIVLNSASAT